MENEMIERVSKALHESVCAERERTGYPIIEKWDDAPETVRGMRRQDARAAIEAVHSALKDKMVANDSIYGPPKDASHLWGRIENALDTSPEWHCEEGEQKTPQAAEEIPG